MRIVHLSDLHVGKTEAEWPAVKQLVNRVAAMRPDVVVVSGDLVDRPDDADTMRQVREVLDQIRTPYLVVPGNHDVQVPAQNRVFEREFGIFPRVERIGQAMFMLFDSFGGLPISERSLEDHECFQNTGCWLDGRVTRTQFAAMETQFSGTETWRIAIVHHHLEPSPHEHVNALRNADEFVGWCKDNRVEYAFVGHLHEMAEALDLGGVCRLRIGRSTKAPYPIGVLDLTTATYEIFQGA